MLGFAQDASGNAASLARIRGPRSGIERPHSVAVDPDGYVYAANFADGFSAAESVTVYPPGAGANTPPVQTIAGPHTQLYEPLGIAVDGAKNIYVLNWDSVNVYPAGANGDVAPIRTIKGADTKFVNPPSIALSGRGQIYIATLDGPLLRDRNRRPVTSRAGLRESLRMLYWQVRRRRAAERNERRCSHVQSFSHIHRL